MKKLTALLLALILVLCCFAGCAQKPEPQEEPEQKQEEEPQPEQEPEPEEEPEPEQEPEPETEEPAEEIREHLDIVWMVANEEGVRPDANPAIKAKLEEMFNVTITIPDVDIHDPSAVEKYFADGGRFDVISTDNYLPLIESGKLRDIPEGWLDTYMPDWMRSIRSTTHKSDTIIKIDTSLDGKQYVVPYGARATAYAMGIRQDWLDNLGLDAPTTLDELHDVLYAFTFDDPDGNGMDDTYGFAPGGGIWNSWGYIEDCFYDSPAAYLVDEEGKVTYPAISEGRREFLRLAKEWMREGIVTPEKNGGDKVSFENGKVGLITDDIDLFYECWDSCHTYKLQQKFPDAKVTILDPLVNEDGKRYFCCYGYAAPLANAGGFAFGVDCSDEVMQRVMEIKNAIAADYELYSAGKDGTSALLGTAPVNMDWWGPYIYNDEFAEANIRFAEFDAILLYHGFNPLRECKELKTYDGGMQSIADKFWWDCLYNQNICDVETGWDDYVSNMYEAGTQPVCDAYTALAKNALGK